MDMFISLPTDGNPSLEVALARKASKCVNCGAPMPRDASECVQCGHRSGERELDTLLKALKVDRSKVQESGTERERASGTLFLCGGCGAFVDASAKACDRCGTPLDFEEEVVPESPLAEPAPRAEAPGPDDHVCTQCGAVLARGAEACVVCGTEAPRLTPAPRAAAAPVSTCETCGAELDANGTCPICTAIDVFTASTVHPPEPVKEVPEPVKEVALRPPEPITAAPEARPSEAMAAPPTLAPAPAPAEPAMAQEPEPAAARKKAKRRQDFAMPLRRPEPEVPARVPEEPPEPPQGRALARRRREPEPVPEPEPVAETEPEAEAEPEPDVVPERAPIASEPQAEETGPEAVPEETFEETVEEAPEEAFVAAEPSRAARRAPAPVFTATDGIEAERAPLPPRPRSAPPRLVLFSEGWVYLSGASLVSVLVLALNTPVLDYPFGPEILLIIFGTLFGTTIALVGACAAGLVMGGRWTALSAAGLLLVAIAPIRWLLGGPFLVEFDALFLGAGCIATLVGAVRIGHKTALLLPAAAGNLLLFLLALTPLTVGTLTALAGDALWAAGGLLVAVAAGMGLEGRFVQSRVDVAVERGRARHISLDAEGSVRAYDRAIRMSRRSATGSSETAWTSKGAALLLLGELDDALKCLDTALKINPTNPVAWLNRGNVLSRKGEFTEALWSFNQAIAANPRYEVAWNNKGNTLARMGKYDEALKCYERALEIDRNYRGAWVNKGFVLAKLGYFEEAAVCADRVLAIAGKGGTAAA